MQTYVQSTYVYIDIHTHTYTRTHTHTYTHTHTHTHVRVSGTHMYIADAHLALNLNPYHELAPSTGGVETAGAGERDQGGGRCRGR